MTIITLTQLCLLIMVLSMMIIGASLFGKYVTDMALNRLKRKTQRDKNSKHIELAELRLEQMEERVSCVETKLQQLRK